MEDGTARRFLTSGSTANGLTAIPSAAPNAPVRLYKPVRHIISIRLVLLILRPVIPTHNKALHIRRRIRICELQSRYGSEDLGHRDDEVCRDLPEYRDFIRSMATIWSQPGGTVAWAGVARTGRVDAVLKECGPEHGECTEKEAELIKVSVSSRGH